MGGCTWLGPLVSAWNVDSGEDDHEVSSFYQFLRWDDLVRRHWQPSLPRLRVAQLAAPSAPPAILPVPIAVSQSAGDSLDVVVDVLSRADKRVER